jgi:uncharacterized protein
VRVTKSAECLTILAMTTYPVREAKLPLPYDEIAEICRRFGVQELWIFGSAPRGDFQRQSDVDFLVVFGPDTDPGPWMRRLTDLENELSRLLGRTVDVVEKRSVEESPNYIRRGDILKSARRVYAA